MGLGPRLARLLRARVPEPGDPVPDAELLSRFAGARDAAAFELLVRRHGAMVLGVCRRLVRDEHLAEDAFQASFLVLARKAGGVRGPNLAGWLYRVARRVAVRARRAAEARAGRERPLPAEPAAPAPRPPDRELAAALDAEVARLPDRFRLPILLCYLGGHTTEEAARALGCPRGTILSRLAAARARLAAGLGRRGFAPPAVGVAAVGVTTPGADAVTATVRAALAYQTLRTGPGLAPAPDSFTLADGVLRAMTTGKLVGLAAAFLIAVGLVSGFGAAAGQPGPGAGKAPDPPAKTPTAAPATDPRGPTPPDEAARRDAQIKALDHQLQELRSQLESREAYIRSIGGAGADDRPALERKLRFLERKFTTDRELAVDEVRRLTKLQFELRQQADDGGDKATVARLQTVATRLAEGRAEIDRLDKAQHEAEAEVARSIARGNRTAFEIDNLRRSMEPLREMIHRLEVRRLELQLEKGGVAGHSPGEPDRKLDAILAELRELRREVRELRRP